jgi:ArsR family transcriptional regulator
VKEPIPSCKADDHDHAGAALPPASLERAAQLFRAMADAPSLLILDLLNNREMCVTEIVPAVCEKFFIVAQRIRILCLEKLIIRRRDVNHLCCAFSVRHVADLILNAQAHENKLNAAPAATSECYE